ncbi:hypothetical protein [Prosthecomicrobium pneumaticum]|uniref:Uncharacterized protein n=1 Tax=Prosthecomicrobium pneumaticum TaxID=81895 RepID=A0A7W9CUS9_9HYPH|nr:hypothetical protein [Prosthecomicrobium pneumaticum]MBB5751953.1 hypothetical protein [Prosthecomicrobium pneumaticum]
MKRYIAERAHRFGFHSDGKPRGWLRRLLINRQKRRLRSVGRLIALDAEGSVRPAFAPWLATQAVLIGQRLPGREETRYAARIRAVAASGRLGAVRSVGIVSTPHTRFVAGTIATALAGTRLACRLYDAPPEAEHDLYIVLCPQMFDRLPPLERTILFQMEQVRASQWVTPAYLSTLAAGLAVLDYSLDNIAALIEHGLPLKQLYHVPIEPPAMPATPPPPGGQTIDVLFYGASNDRRRRYFEALRSHVELRVVTEVFGDDLYRLLRSAKVVVNVHYYEGALLETTRLSEALSFGARVVSEQGVDQADQGAFEDRVDFVPTGDIDAFVARTLAVLAQENRPDKAEPPRPVAETVRGSRFGVLRALHGVGALTLDELDAASAGIALPSDRVVLAFPEHIARFRFAETNRLAGAAVFPCLRHIDGWKGCAESYKFIARRALGAGTTRLTVYEDDAAFAPGTADRLAAVERYLDGLGGAWDVFSGLLSDLRPDFAVSHVEERDGERFIHVDTVIGAVFAIYNASALGLLAAFEFEGEDPARHTIDRYLERRGLRCITTAVPVAGHAAALDSTLWPATNERLETMIEASLRRLEAKAAAFKRAAAPGTADTFG